MVDKYIDNNFCFGFTLNNNDNYSLLLCIVYKKKTSNKTNIQEIKKNLTILLYF